MEELDKELLELVKEVLTNLNTKVRSEVETEHFKVKGYFVNSPSRYAHASMRIDIQNLEPRNYS